MSTPLGTASSKANNVVNISTPGDDKVGVFVTPQSLVTFPVATASVTTIWKVVGQIYTPFGPSNKVVPVVLAVAVGLYIFSISVKGETGREKWNGLGIALINSFTIAAAALGIG